MTQQATPRKVAIVMAGGTGGHIFPGLAVAQALIQAGWRVHWVGSSANMEWDIIRPTGIPFESVHFSGLRGKSITTLLAAPWRLLKAMVRAASVLKRVKPSVVLGFGGYITVPAGLVSKMLGIPLVIHEQNRIAGMTNKLLAKIAAQVHTAFPDVLPQSNWVGNPLRQAFEHAVPPQGRFDGRSGPLKVLVVGGSLGAQSLNTTVPEAFALLPPEQRPVITHQSGKSHLATLLAHYQSLGVKGEVVPFIDDMAKAFAEADLVICRAGASTVTEVAAIGVACLFVPLPTAVDDHQTANAKYLTEVDAGWLMPQSQLTAAALSQFIQGLDRSQLVAIAGRAYAMRKVDAVAAMVNSTEAFAS